MRIAHRVRVSIQEDRTEKWIKVVFFVSYILLTSIAITGLFIELLHFFGGD